MTSQRFLIITAIMTILLSSGNWLLEQPRWRPSLTSNSNILLYHKADINEKEITMRFPIATGSNLQRKEVTLPKDFDGEMNVILIAFEQWQQETVNTWLPFVEQLEQRYEGVRYYELPVIQQRNVIARTFINEGMRAGIPDAKSRDRTITLYLDKWLFGKHWGYLTSETSIFWSLIGEETSSGGARVHLRLRKVKL